MLFTTTMLCGYKAPNQFGHQAIEVEIYDVLRAKDQYSNDQYIMLSDKGNFIVKGDTKLHTSKVAANLKIGPKKRKIVLHVHYFNLADGGIFTYFMYVCNAFEPEEGE